MHALLDPTALDDLLDDEPALRNRLQDDDAVVRHIALIELSELEDERLLPWQIALLRDASDVVREEAAKRLAAWEREDTVGALVAALEDEHAGVRDAAAQSLSELKQTEAGRWLLPALSHPVAFVRASVLRALRELRQPDAVVPTTKLLDDEDASVRREAVVVIGWLKVEAALPLIAGMAARDPSAEVRRAAAGALGCTSRFDGAVLEALRTALVDADWTVREEAATTLAKLRWSAARDALIAALADGYWQVALRAARALGRLGVEGRACLDALVGLLDAPMANLRKEVVIALGELRDPAARPALQRASADTDPDVRKLARLALTQIEASSPALARSSPPPGRGLG